MSNVYSDAGWGVNAGASRDTGWGVSSGVSRDPGWGFTGGQVNHKERGSGLGGTFGMMSNNAYNPVAANELLEKEIASGNYSGDQLLAMKNALAQSQGPNMPNTSLNAMQPSPDMTPDPNAPDFGGDLFEYKPAYGQAAPLTAGFSAGAGSQYQGSPLAAPTLGSMPGAGGMGFQAGAPAPNMPGGNVPQAGGINAQGMGRAGAPAALRPLQMQQPTAGYLDPSAVQNQLMGAMTGKTQLAQLDPLMDEMNRRQALARDEFKASQAARNVRGSTPADNAMMDFDVNQANQLSNAYNQASNQAMNTQANVLGSLMSGQGAQRSQQVNELLQSLGLGEQLQQGEFGRDFAERQQGQSEQAQLYGQQMQERAMQGQEAQQQFQQELQARALAGDEGAREFLQNMQVRQQGVAEQAQGFGQGMNQANQNLMRDLAIRGQNVSEQQQRFNQMMGGRGQNFGEFMQMAGAQSADDAARNAQGQNAIASLMQAMGMNVTGGSPQFPGAQPGAAESLMTLFGQLMPGLINQG